MKINEAALDFSSRRSFIQRDTSQQFLSIWQGRRRLADAAGKNTQGSTDAKETEQSAAERKSLQQGPSVRNRILQQHDFEIPGKMKMFIELKIRLLRALFGKITGRNFKIFDPAKLLLESDTSAVDAAKSGIAGATSVRQTGLTYNYTTTHYESEKVDFSAAGLITTADGSEISLSLTMSMSREFYSAHSTELDIGLVLKDPLVLNFDGEATDVTERNFHFDIDADGTVDQISFVEPGSGFLALDKNGDGTIGDGSELFGAVSGDGFAELGQYDRDGNHWIDENDAIFQRLRIWSRNEDGEDQLVALGQAGVGAIYLEHVETQFSLKDDENGLLGQIRDTGLAVMETGQAVTLQQLDVVV